MIALRGPGQQRGQGAPDVSVWSEAQCAGRRPTGELPGAGRRGVGRGDRQTDLHLQALVPLQRVVVQHDLAARRRDAEAGQPLPELAETAGVVRVDLRLRRRRSDADDPDRVERDELAGIGQQAVVDLESPVDARQDAVGLGAPFQDVPAVFPQDVARALGRARADQHRDLGERDLEVMQESDQNAGVELVEAVQAVARLLIGDRRAEQSDGVVVSQPLGGDAGHPREPTDGQQVAAIVVHRLSGHTAPPRPMERGSTMVSSRPGPTAMNLTRVLVKSAMNCT